MGKIKNGTYSIGGVKILVVHPVVVHHDAKREDCDLRWLGLGHSKHLAHDIEGWVPAESHGHHPSVGQGLRHESLGYSVVLDAEAGHGGAWQEAIQKIFPGGQMDQEHKMFWRLINPL